MTNLGFVRVLIRVSGHLENSKKVCFADLYKSLITACLVLRRVSVWDELSSSVRPVRCMSIDEIIPARTDVFCTDPTLWKDMRGLCVCVGICGG